MQGVAHDGEGFNADRAIGPDEVGDVQKDWVQFIWLDELRQIDGVRGFELHRIQSAVSMTTNRSFSTS